MAGEWEASSWGLYLGKEARGPQAGGPPHKPCPAMAPLSSGKNPSWVPPSSPSVESLGPSHLLTSPHKLPSTWLHPSLLSQELCSGSHPFPLHQGCGPQNICSYSWVFNLPYFFFFFSQHIRTFISLPAFRANFLSLAPVSPPVTSLLPSHQGPLKSRSKPLLPHFSFTAILPARCLCPLFTDLLWPEQLSERIRWSLYWSFLCQHL